MVNYSAVEKAAEKLHSAAKNGTLKIRDITYQFIFDHYQGVYHVEGPEGREVSFNTRKISVARKWFKEWLS